MVFALNQSNPTGIGLKDLQSVSEKMSVYYRDSLTINEHLFWDTWYNSRGDFIATFGRKQHPNLEDLIKLQGDFERVLNKIAFY